MGLELTALQDFTVIEPPPRLTISTQLQCKFIEFLNGQVAAIVKSM